MEKNWAGYYLSSLITYILTQTRTTNYNGTPENSIGRKFNSINFAYWPSMEAVCLLAPLWSSVHVNEENLYIHMP